METIEVSKDSPLVGLTIEAARHNTGAAILAIVKRNGRLITHPTQEETAEEGDHLIIIGTKKGLIALEDISEGVQAQ